MVFYGEYSVSFTGAGRIVLPKKIRELLQGDEFVISKGVGNCLAGYNKADWEQRAQELMNVSLLEREHLEKRRMLFSSAAYTQVDDQGRFVVPRSLLKTLDKSKKAVIIGVGDHFEIWDETVWQEYQATFDNE